MWLEASRIGEENKCQGLGDLLGERVIENERIIAPFAGRYIVCPLCDLVCLTLARPFDYFEPNSRQLLDNGRLLLPRAGSSRRCGEVLGGIGALGIGGRNVGAQRRGLARVFEYAKVDRLLVRLNTPRDGVVGADIDPTYKVRLEISVETKSFCGNKPYLAVNLQLFHGRHNCTVRVC
jgi:hypothetical protein